LQIKVTPDVILHVAVINYTAYNNNNTVLIICHYSEM